MNDEVQTVREPTKPKAPAKLSTIREPAVELQNAVFSIKIPINSTESPSMSILNRVAKLPDGNSCFFG